MPNVKVKITKPVSIGRRQFDKGVGYEVTVDEFRQLVRLKAAVPVGDRGGLLTTTRLASEMVIRG